MATTKYPLDTTGTAPSNLISDEIHSVQPPADIKDASFIVPRASPFFATKMEIWTGPKKTGNKLLEGRDYFFTHYFVAGSRYYGPTFYGGIAWLDQTFKGTVYLTYQVLGGEFTVNSTSEVEYITNKLYPNLRVVTWDQIKGVPSTLPPDAHYHHVDDINFAHINATAKDIADAIRGTGGSGGGGSDGALALIQQHLSAISGAHRPAAVGLGNVSNYPMATSKEAEASSALHYASPSTVSYMIKRAIAGENLTDIRNRVITLEDDVVKIKGNIVGINNHLAEVDRGMAEMNSSIADLDTKIANNVVVLNRVEQTAINAAASASLAMAQAAANAANIENLAIRINTAIYAGTHTYGVGNHELLIPPKAKLRVVLIGAGGGSGAMYDLKANKEKNTYRATDGEDTSLMLLGSDKVPIEPIAVCVAGGGRRGDDNYEDGGVAQGGEGGVCLSMGNSLSVSVVPNISYDNLVDVPDDKGKKGNNGDSSSTGTGNVKGTDGTTINTSGDILTSQMYGKGRDGIHKAGMGGSGGRTAITIDNNSNEDYRVQICVGYAGNTSRGEGTTEGNIFLSHGVAYTTYVN